MPLMGSKYFSKARMLMMKIGTLTTANGSTSNRPGRGNGTSLLPIRLIHLVIWNRNLTLRRLWELELKWQLIHNRRREFNGVLYMDNVKLDTDPPIRFDFEQLEIETDFVELQCSVGVLRVFVFADGGASRSLPQRELSPIRV